MNRHSERQRGIIAWFAHNPVAANLLMAIILVAGVLTAINLKVEDFPSSPPNSVSIDVSYDSGSASATEQGVTIKLEEALNGVPGVAKISSTSTGSGSAITVEKSSTHDLETLYQDIKNRVDNTSSLPLEAEQPLVSRQLDAEEALSVQVYGSAEQQTLQHVARQLRDRLLANPIIEEVFTNGGLTPEILIEVDERALQAQGLTLPLLSERVAAASVIAAGGELYSDAGSLTIKADQPRYYLREFEQIAVKIDSRGRQVLLRDVATVRDGYSQSAVISRFNGERAIELAVKTYGNSDVMKISREVAAEVESFSAKLPEGVKLRAWIDDSVFIADRLGLLLNNSLMGIALVMVMLALFLNVRVAFWVGAGLPVIFAGAMLLLGPNFFDMTLNELTTFGFIIALGIVVDDAVVVGESVHAERERYGATIEATVRGAQRVAQPTVFGVLTTVVAFLSLSLVEGELGKIFALFAYTAAFCLLFSLVESKLILPAHLAGIAQTKAPSNPLAKAWGALQGVISRALTFWIKKVYRPFIHTALDARYAVLLVALSIFVLVGGMVPSGKIRGVFLPDIPGNVISVSLALEDDAGAALVQRQALQIEQLGMRISADLQREFALEAPPIRNLMTMTTQNSASLTAEVSPRDERPFVTTLITERWEEAVGKLEGVRRLSFTTDNDDDAAISLELRAEDRETLTQVSRIVSDELQRFSAVSGVQNSLRTSQPQIDLTLTPEGRALGLSTADLARQIRNAYSGLEAQRIQRGRDEIKVLLRYPDAQRRGLADLSLARIRTADGRALPLSTVAEVSTRYVAKEIQRKDRSRVAEITADLDQSQVSANEVLAQLESELFVELRKRYPSLQIALTGDAERESEIQGSLVFAFSVALLAIYALLAIPLKSYAQPLLIMSVIPFGVIGALLGLWLHDMALSILAMFGILALCGVVVNDSLLLISRFNEYRALGKPVKLAMVEAACSRMRAIMLTSITTYVGLLPLMFDSSESAQMLIPAAVALGYGILFATAITLVLVPALVMIREDFSFKRSKRKNADREIADEYQRTTG